MIKVFIDDIIGVTHAISRNIIQINALVRNPARTIKSSE
jgi:hypothetical protein